MSRGDGDEFENTQAAVVPFDASSMRELHPPRGLPNGNVGTPLKIVFHNINRCVIPPRVIATLGIDLKKKGVKRRYAQVKHHYDDYGGFDDDDGKDSDDDECGDQDCEDWERYTATKHSDEEDEKKAMLSYENDVELQWEKGGSGLVFYTDKAAYWDKLDKYDDGYASGNDGFNGHQDEEFASRDVLWMRERRKEGEEEEQEMRMKKKRRMIVGADGVGGGGGGSGVSIAGRRDVGRLRNRLRVGGDDAAYDGDDDDDGDGDGGGQDSRSEKATSGKEKKKVTAAKWRQLNSKGTAGSPKDVSRLTLTERRRVRSATSPTASSRRVPVVDRALFDVDYGKRKKRRWRAGLSEEEEEREEEEREDGYAPYGGGSGSGCNGALSILEEEEQERAERSRQPFTFDHQFASSVMRRWGWTKGTGLGREETGPLTPLVAEVPIGREGIGFVKRRVDIGGGRKGSRGGNDNGISGYLIGSVYDTRPALHKRTREGTMLNFVSGGVE
eukprot:TRINITY_DN3459_c0_g1_i2.p1 TRINITY_DN3459_c0_g1~~TRINITY_DN3459_c0_g1_i2.p1  ORF type:complete len:500 (+),score=165.74 TRINITY_DN3459_c0_g1_i2:618-2117(+)